MSATNNGPWDVWGGRKSYVGKTFDGRSGTNVITEYFAFLGFKNEAVYETIVDDLNVTTYICFIVHSECILRWMNYTKKKKIVV